MKQKNFMLPWLSGKASCPDQNLFRNLEPGLKKTKRMYPSTALKNEKFEAVSELVNQEIDSSPDDGFTQHYKYRK